MFIRPPAVAGSFYPSDPEELKDQIQGYLSGVKSPSPPPKGMIAPHAGTIYSGPVAASAYATLSPRRKEIKRVVLLGPAHRVGFEGLALSSASAFATPLGEIPVDQQIRNQLSKFPQIAVFDEAHREEHSLELHLPFLQETLADFSLIPIVVGWAEPGQVSQVIETLWGGKETLLVVSSDLSHYLDYETAKEWDKKTTSLIEKLQWEKLEHDQACGFFPVRGMLEAAKKHGMKVKTADLRNSGDTAGPKDQVVGYGSYLFYEP